MKISDIPFNYAMCIQTNCPMAKSCLRAMAYALTPKEEQYIRVVNPSAASASEYCCFYRDSKPVAYAKGFVKMKDEMLTWQYSDFTSRMIAHFGRNSYFVRRRGECLLPISEQEIILKTLKDIGIEKHLEFDKYIDCLEW